MKHREIKLSGDRMATFSDGVFAIIITLMVLGIQMPNVAKNATSEEVWKQLSTMMPSLIAYGISFFSLAIFWANHHNFFHMLKHVDRSLMWLNMITLFWLSLLPLPTAFMAKHFDKPESTILFGLCMFLCNGFFGLLFYYAVKSKLIIDKLNKRLTKQIIKMIVISCVLWLVSAAVGYISVYISYGIYLLIGTLFFLPQNVEVEEEGY